MGVAEDARQVLDVDCLRGRPDEAERDALAERMVTYMLGLLDRLDETIGGELTRTGVL